MKINQKDIRVLKNTGNIQTIKVKKNELPLYCPREKSNWHLHPRVYIPIKEEGLTNCPYCGAIYEIVTSK